MLHIYTNKMTWHKSDFCGIYMKLRSGWDRAVYYLMWSLQLIAVQEIHIQSKVIKRYSELCFLPIEAYTRFMLG